MSEWQECNLDEIYEFASGLSKPRSEFGSGYPFLSFKDVFYNYFVPSTLESLVRTNEKERQRCSVRRGDVFLTRTSETMDELGMSCVALHDVPDATFNGFTKRLRPKREDVVLPEYAGYFFRSRGFREDIMSMTTMSTRASLNNEMLGRLKIKLPPASVQFAIGSMLLSLDDKIELNRRMNETLEGMARAIFKDWFVDFGPTRAKAEGRTAYLAPVIWDLFPDALDDGDKPMGWHQVKIKDVADKIAMGPFGSNIKVSTFVAEGVPIISGQHLNKTMLEESSFNYITTEHAEKLKNSNVFGGDIVFTHAGNIGQVSYIPDSSAFDRYVLSQRQFYLRCDKEEVSPLFLVYFFKSDEGQHKLLANTSSTGVPSISRPVTNLKTIDFCLPPKELIGLFGDFVRVLHQKIGSNRREIDTLAATRDFLLPKLMSGEIRIRDAEQAVEAVA